jgi:hypothetical protein
MKPRCALRVGIIGNRRFGGETDTQPTAAGRTTAARASEALAAVWQAVFDGVERALNQPVHQGPRVTTVTVRDLFAGDRPRIAVVTSLAAGADQIGAQRALEQAKELANDGVRVELEAVLPFKEVDYPGLPHARRPEFREHEAETLRTLAAAARQVVRLDGVYDDPHMQVHGYRQASAIVRQSSDVLIAVYDPHATPKAGGTIETVALALQSRTPVVAILVSDAHTRVSVRTQPSEHALSPDEEWSAARPVADEGWRSLLADAITSRLSLPEACAPREHTRSHAHDAHDQSEELAHAFRRLRLISGEEALSSINRGKLRARIFTAAWKSLFAIAALFAKHRPRRGASETVTARVDLHPYDAFYRRASELSAAYMRTYRGGFVLSYFLAWLAVVIAVTGMTLWLVLMPEKPRVEVIAGLGTLKLALIAVLYLLERAGHRERFQEAAADFRYLAELLRPMQWLAPLGATPPSVEVPIHATWHDPARSWMVWMARAISRSVPAFAKRRPDGSWHYPHEVTIDAVTAADALERARTEWLEEQATYHHHTAGRMHALNEGLERLAKWSIAVVGLAALGALVLETLALTHYEPVKSLTYWAEEHHALAMILSAAAVVLPALVVVIAGLAFQSEAKRLAMRSEAMYLAMSEYQQQLQEAEGSLRAPGGHAGEAMHAAQMLRTVSAVTIGEAADWKLLYEVHGIPNL